MPRIDYHCNAIRCSPPADCSWPDCPCTVMDIEALETECARLRRVNAGLVEAVTEALDIIDQGDVSEVWQTALVKLRIAHRAALRSATETKGEPA